MTFNFLQHKLFVCTLLFAQVLLAKSNHSSFAICDNLPTDIVLLGQEAINEFPILYPGCEIVHNLSIEGAFDLSPLSQIRQLTGNLTIKNNPELFELQGLQALTHIEGNFIRLGAMLIIS